jgi:hypothetical protein
MPNVQETSWIPSSDNVTDWRLNIGRHALASREGLKHDLALAGPPGLLSIFETLLFGEAHLTRDDLLTSISSLIRSDMRDAAEELLDFFKGPDPRRHLWDEGPDGYYHLLGPHEDFPN